MNFAKRLALFLVALLVALPALAAEGEHPKLILTKDGVEQIRAPFPTPPVSARRRPLSG